MLADIRHRNTAPPESTATASSARHWPRGCRQAAAARTSRPVIAAVSAMCSVLNVIVVVLERSRCYQRAGLGQGLGRGLVAGAGPAVMGAWWGSEAAGGC